MQEKHPKVKNWVLKLNKERYGRGIAYINTKIKKQYFMENQHKEIQNLNKIVTFAMPSLYHGMGMYI